MRGGHAAAMHPEEGDSSGDAHDGAGEPGPYRIHAVAALTGVPEPTLRAWERRYGIPTPERTASGYRLYGAREVAQVREMQRLCAQGMAAAEAARTIATDASLRPGTAHADPDSFAAAVDGILEAVAKFDDVSLDKHLRRAMFLGSTGAVADRVILPALERIGDRWHQGQLTVAQEHFGSYRLGTTMRDLLRLSVHEDARALAVVACFADEDHDIGALAAAMRLANWGLRPIFLGARTPPEAIKSAVEGLAPKMVALSISLAPKRPRARELVEGYAEACGEVPWMVGGAGAQAIAPLVRKAGGVVAPDDGRALRALVRRILAEEASGPAEGLDVKSAWPEA
jgi:DNA-binding transcriptional MerR regulator/methylmalonyl-CoA mutase cobalamin-binding subunit